MNFKKEEFTINVSYYAVLREQRGCQEETITTTAMTPIQLYQELQSKYKFTLSSSFLKVAINDEFKDWQTPLKPNDRIVFIPPVAGG